MEQVMSYVKPELLAVAVVLYFCGIGLKRIQIVKDKYIPVILGGAGILLCAVWVLATSPFKQYTGNCDGGIHFYCAGRPGCRFKHLCESDDQTGK